MKLVLEGTSQSFRVEDPTNVQYHLDFRDADTGTLHRLRVPQETVTDLIGVVAGNAPNKQASVEDDPVKEYAEEEQYEEEEYTDDTLEGELDGVDSFGGDYEEDDDGPSSEDEVGSL